MRRLVYYVASTEDGYIAGPRGQYDFFALPPSLVRWINEEYPDTIPTHLREALGTPNGPRRFDAVVMGRSTYETGGVASPYGHLRQYVCSRTLRPTEHSGITIIGDDAVAAIRRLKAEDGLDIWLCGGGALAGVLYDEIDVLVIKRQPILAGAGVPMIAGPFRPRAFDRVAHAEIGAGITVTTLAARRTDAVS
jgi:dihydrofolate reductase